MEELICQVIGLIAEFVIEVPEIFRYRWFRWAFGLTMVALAGLIVYFYWR